MPDFIIESCFIFMSLGIFMSPFISAFSAPGLSLASSAFDSPLFMFM